MGNSLLAIILAGGKGERLRPITNNLPKPMVILNDKPLLEYVINQFKKNNITDLIISVCYLPNVITDYFGDGNKFGVNISYIYESPDKPLGTAGSIAKLRKNLNDTFIVCYGDSLRNFNIKALLKQHSLTKPKATICAYKNKSLNPKSVIVFNKDHIIQSFVERPRNTELLSHWSNAGFYVLEPNVFKYIPQNEKSDFGKDIFPALIAKGKRLEAFILDEYFLDIGTIEKVRKAQNDILNGRLMC